LLDRGGKSQYLRFGNLFDGHYFSQTWPAFGESARLIHDQRVNFLQSLQRCGILDENAIFCPPPRRRP
jgi:hypothetical protein